ncbi:SCO2400 family protein [Streptomyces koelreuteriae]|uniref:SCO2400 family protein n=1 Tax=Streptomyces koelreuteriae TaxID=2838015 RepID=UPI003EB88A4B
MDYCSSCRRHLNGALVCPGCGAYAPDIDPSAPSAWRDGNVWDDRTVWDENRAGTRELHLAYPGPFAGCEAPAADPVTDPAGGHETPDTAPSDGHGSADTAPADDYRAPQQGRAARRRQLARWKKNQRRAVVATAVALVGGGLTVAAMKGDAKPGVQAATAPEDTTMGGAGGEASAYTEPTSTQRDTPRSTPTGPETRKTPHREQPRTTEPRTTRADPRTDAAATPRELPLTTPQQRTSVPSTVDTVTGTAGAATSEATERTTPPASGTGADTQQPADPTTPPPSASPTPTAPSDSGSGSNSDSDSKPKELCLLVICLG